MNEGAEILSREELDAILAELVDGRRVNPTPGHPEGPFRRERSRAAPPPETGGRLQDGVAGMTSLWAKRLGSRHQRRIECASIGWEEVDVGEVAETLLPSDRVVLLEFSPGGREGFVFVGRPLVFALLTLAFGGRRVADVSVPVRGYTGIERRFLAGVARELAALLEAQWRSENGIRVKAGAVVGGAELVDLAVPQLAVASVEVRGLGPVGRLRVGLPSDLLDPAAGPARRPAASARADLGGDVRSLAVVVRAELGATEITLAQLGALRPGDVLRLRPSASEGLLLRVEGRPKLRGVRGSVGGRLAVQVTERLDGAGGVR